MKRTKTKSLFWLLATLLLAAICAVAADAETVGGYCGAEGDGTHVAWEYDTETNLLTIRGSGAIKNYGTSYQNQPPWQGDNSNRYGIYITDVIIQEGITAIGAYTFLGCKNLKTILIPASVSTIAGMAFSDCEKLEHISVDSGSISFAVDDRGCLYNAAKTDLIRFPSISTETVYEIPNTVTSLRMGAFEYCSSLKRIVIPNCITSLPRNAFYCCSSLEDIDLPAGLTEIGKKAFYWCRSLKNITIPDGVNQIDEFVFYGCSSLTSVTLSPNVHEIQNYAFDGCTSLTDIVFPNVNIIGKRAFSSCVSLKNLVLPERLVAIYQYAFYHCKSIESITIPETVSYIEGCTFYECTSLQSVEFSSQMKSIPIQFLCGCSALEEIIVPDNVENIYSEALCNCKGLKRIRIGSGVKYIAEGSFYGCSILETIEVDGNNTTYHAQGNCLIETASKTLVLGCGASIIPSDGSVTDIGSFAFSGSGTLESIVVPNCVKIIGESAFSSCGKIETIRLGSKIERIGHNAFASKVSLKSIKTCMSEPEWMQVEKAESWNPYNVQITFNAHVEPDAPTAENPVSPTCTEQGSHEDVEYCIYCSKELSRETIPDPALGHDYTGTPVEENAVGPDCTHAGSYDLVLYCKRCPQELSREPMTGDPALGHDYTGTPVEENRVDPDCTHTGTYELVLYCKVCGDELSRERVTGDPAPGHTFGKPTWNWTSDYEQATATFTCSVCGEELTLTAKLSDGSLTVSTTPENISTYFATVTLNGETHTSKRVVHGPYRCGMCDTYDAMKGTPIVGWIVAFIHNFVHMASLIGRAT